MSKPKAIICDIDGCVIDTSRIYEEIAEKGITGADKFAYFEEYANDPAKALINQQLVDILEFLRMQGYKIIFSTARSKAIKVGTITRLRGCMMYSDIYMRDLDDFRPAAEVKTDHLKRIKEFYDVHIAIDDEDDNLKMFSQNNILAMKVITKGRQA